MVNNKKTLYEILGVKSDADENEIKKAYRERAKETHPDVSTGSEEEFKEVYRAYSILISPQKRQIYDTTGIEDDSVIDPDTEIKVFIQEVFQRVISEEGSETIPIFEVMRNFLNKKIQQIQNKDTEIDCQISKFKTFQKNIKGKDDFFHIFLEENINTLKKSKEINKLEIEKMKKALKFLEGYDYSFEESLAKSAKASKVSTKGFFKHGFDFILK